jgi:hypothetical protein
MQNKILWLVVLVLIIVGVYVYTSTSPGGESDNEISENSMSFFVSSENPGDGADFGGLSGADQYCQSLASTSGAGEKQWRAYLSTVSTDTEEGVNARDRIGNGPWYNFNGEIVANNVEELHGDSNPISKTFALNEKGEQVNGRGDTPNVHDILTGSNADGTLAVGEGDTTCGNWTSESEDGSAVVGHHDRVGIDDSAPMKSWNSSHGSRGCSLANLNSTGGGGLLYCFAIN